MFSHTHTDVHMRTYVRTDMHANICMLAHTHTHIQNLMPLPNVSIKRKYWEKKQTYREKRKMFNFFPSE